jgi:hypothetical protein
MRAAALLQLALLACVDPREPTPDSDAPDPPGDPTPVEHSDPPLDSEPIAAETDESEPIEPLAPPTTWGGGLVELAALLDPAHAFPVDPGDPIARRAPQTVHAFFADLDGDGVAELLVASVARGGDDTHQLRHDRVLRWQGDDLVDDPALAAALPAGPHPPAAAFDVDGDGLIDLLGASREAFIAWGTVAGGWGPWTRAPVAAEDPAWQSTSLPAVFDLDRDGWADLIYATESCQTPPTPLLRTAPRRFMARPDLGFVGAGDVRHAALLATRLADGEALFVQVAEACTPLTTTPGFARQTAVSSDGVPRFGAVDALDMDLYWDLDPTFAGRPFTAIAPMGAGVADLDADGLLDVVITLGHGTQAVLRGRPDGSFTDDGLPTLSVAVSPFGTPEFPWSVGFPDLDQDGRSDLLWSAGDDATSFLVARGHPMPNVAYWNAGPALVDVSVAIGLGAQGSYHAMGLADPDGDGDADLVFGGYGAPSVAYRNDIDVGNHGLSVVLVGTTSDRQAIGAHLVARGSGRPEQRQVVGGTAGLAGASEPISFFGTGAETTLDTLEIVWPSGFVQQVRDLATGSRHMIVEPPIVEVLDADRRGIADGESEISLRITPRLPDGAFDSTVSVEVVLHGAGALVGPVQAQADHWLVAVRAPETWGEAWLEIRFNGVAQLIRPKLWWD